MSLRDVSVLLDHRDVLEGDGSRSDDFTHTQIRMRIFERYSFSQINNLVENVCQTLKHQFSRLSNICYNAWMKWDSSTFFWTILPESQESQTVIREVLFTPELEDDLTPIQKRVNFKEFGSVISVFKSKKSDMEKPRTCCICLEEMKLYRMWARFPCGHVMHSNCARTWLCKHSNEPTCPECRQNVRRL